MLQTTEFPLMTAQHRPQMVLQLIIHRQILLGKRRRNQLYGHELSLVQSHLGVRQAHAPNVHHEGEHLRHQDENLLQDPQCVDRENLLGNRL